jgi:hypothetical protein
MTQRQIESWAKIRKAGRRQFILFRGVLGWGVFTAVMWSVVVSMLDNVGFAQLFTGAIVLFPLAGVIWGATNWSASERSYADYLSRNPHWRPPV